MGGKSKDQFRFKSVRGCRRYLEEMLHQVRRGERPPQDVRDVTPAVREVSHMIMAENLMALQGIKDIETKDPGDLGPDGGFKYTPKARAKRHRKVKVVTREGINRTGPIDVTETHVDGGEGLDD